MSDYMKLSHFMNISMSGELKKIMKNTDVLFEAISVSFIEIKESTLDQFVTEYFLTVFLEIERATLFNLTDLEIDLNSPRFVCFEKVNLSPIYL